LQKLRQMGAQQKNHFHHFRHIRRYLSLSVSLQFDIVHALCYDMFINRQGVLIMGAQKNPDRTSRRKTWMILAYAAAAIAAVAGVILRINGISAGSTAVIVSFWVALFVFLIGKEQKKKQEDERSARLGMIKLPTVASEYHDQDYRAILSAYQRLGFRNVTAVNLHDLHRVVLKKPGTTECVTIGGKKAGVNEWYDPDAEVLITYHGFAE